jgi:phosphatidylserine/phosphatidylglycerophosphate/cardiolipin synthase-like enzyme
MRKTTTAAALLALILSAGLLLARDTQPLTALPAATDTGVSVWFSPDGGCTAAVVGELAKARREVLVQAYSFTSAPIAKALVDAKNRGVKVTVILDKSQRTEQYSSATFLKNQRVPIFIDADHAIAHNKVMMIDGATVITGSFNFTKAAEENNAENLLVIRDRPALVKAYAANFREHLGHSEAYTSLKEGK